jgi:signal transduction histidine kinase
MIGIDTSGKPTPKKEPSVRPADAPYSVATTEAASEMAQEIIDMLTVILGHAALLDVTLPESDSRREDVMAIVAAAAQASRITAHLLSVSRDT